jgi:hypothetical protein
MRRTAFLPLALAGLALSACGSSSKQGMEVPWLRAEPSGDGRVLRVGYESDPCTTARRARVKEDEGTVTVTLRDPRRDPERYCILTARKGCVTVRLEQPLGARRVVDGARDPFPQRKRGAARQPFRLFGPCRAVPVDD